MIGAFTNFVRARERVGLSLDLFARMMGLSPERLRALESGALPNPSELDAAARAFGVRIKDSSESSPESWPLARLIFRAGEAGATALGALVDDGSYTVLGEFLRSVADLDQVERATQCPRRELPKIQPPVGWEAGPPWGAPELARQLRQHLELGASDSIPRMGELLEALGVACFFTRPERLSPSVDAASTLVPRPAVLINLIEGEHAWWRTRISLAHELCHLLLDHSEDLPATLSPERHVRSRYVYLHDLTMLERRANAFAAELLAPTAGVRELVAGLLPSNREAVELVGSSFGVGRVVAINRLANTYGLSQETRQRMIDRGGEHWEAEGGYQEAVEVGLRNGALLRGAMRAYAARAIDAIEVRRMLSIGLTEALPTWEGLSEERVRPVRPPEIHALTAAGQFLAANKEPRLIALRPRATPNGWLVDIEGANDARTLSMSFDYQVSPPEWLSAQS